MRNHTETAQVIQLSAFRTSGGKRFASRSRPVAANPQCEENVSTTCKNQRIRQQLHVNWRKADALREYWRASLEMSRAIPAFKVTTCPKAIFIPNAIGMTIGQYLQNIARRSCSSCSRPHQPLRRSHGSARRSKPVNIVTQT
jgi:hypothetical protein